MKQQSCPMSVIGIPALTGQAWNPEEGARLIRLLFKPVVIGIAIALVCIALLVGARIAGSDLMAANNGPLLQFAVNSQKDHHEERQLQSDTQRLLAGFEAEDAVPNGMTVELP